MLFGVIQTGRPALMPHSHWFILYVRRRTSDMHNMRKCLPIFKSAHQLFIHIYCYPSFEKSVLVNMCMPYCWLQLYAIVPFRSSQKFKIFETFGRTIRCRRKGLPLGIQATELPIYGLSDVRPSYVVRSVNAA